MTKLSEIMNRTLITVDTHASLRQAQRILDRRNIRHLFVMDGKRLVGIVTDRDLRKAAPSSNTLREESERTPVRLW